MAENTKAKAKKSSLDRSIDLGLDQFGRFVRLRWFWLVVVSIIIWYTFVFVVPQLSAPSPGSILYYAFQISFALLFGIMQFVAIFWFLGRPRLYWVMPGETGVTFEDYKGNPEVLEAARRIVGLLRGVKEFQQMGGSPVRGLLLSGPPGTGKSYLAQCMSTEAGVPFAYASAASFRAMFIGMDILMIRRLYSKARRLAREYGGCVVFMDEIDAIGASRGGGGMGLGGGMMGLMGGAGTGGLNQLLMEMDPPNIETGWFKKILRTIGLTHSRVQNEPVLTVAATNIPESIDRALLRPGRFDRKIHVAPPTDKYRAEVILYYLNKVEHDPDISINALVQRLVDYTPVAIKHVINEAVIIAHFDGRDKITYKDLIEAQDVHEFGLRQTSELTPIDRRRLAYHEAGHAVASYYLYERYFPAYVTIHQRSDLEGLWGMDGTLASARVVEVPQTKLDERVEKLLQSQFKAVKNLLQDHKEALIAVAEALIEHDELVAEEIKQLIDEADARKVTRVVLSDFEAILGTGNGHSNGNGKNGYALTGGNGNGNVPAGDSPRIGSTPSTSSLPPSNEVTSIEQVFTDEDAPPFIDK
ncbi:MAG: AAA family ATPase [Chloroflexi bacterium]|nr:MAG: AAA family ATPase [Chloroflexota bacterium]